MTQLQSYCHCSECCDIVDHIADIVFREGKILISEWWAQYNHRIIVKFNILDLNLKYKSWAQL